MLKTFKVSFPIYATGYDIVEIEESELEGKSEGEIKEILYLKTSTPTVCQQCAQDVEEIEFDTEHVGKSYENVSYWEEEQ